jgi:hypothetical protein
MQETAEDLARLRAIIAHSIEAAGPFLRSSFQIPEHSLSVEQLVAVFSGPRTVALATATRSGAPRVAPIGCHLLGGRFYIPTTRTAARSRMVTRQPEVSLTAFDANDLAVIVHGRARMIDNGSPLFERVEGLRLGAGQESVRSWGAPGDGCYLEIEPATILTYTRYPARED